MNNDETKAAESGETPEYEAPRIEVMISRSDLDREVHYAGRVST